MLRTAAAMRAFGAEVERVGDGRWRVDGRGRLRRAADVIDCGNAGTGARLIMGAAAGFRLTATFTGDASLRARPMARVLDPAEPDGRARGSAATAGGCRSTLSGGALPAIDYRLPEPRPRSSRRFCSPG